MAEQSGGEKTLPASPRRIERAREEGNIAKSPDLNAAIGLLGALAVMYQLGPAAMTSMFNAMTYYLAESATLRVTIDDAQSIAIRGLYFLFIATAPMIMVLLVLGVTVSVMQVGFLLAFKAITPKLDRINPISGFQKFFTIRSLVELVKSLMKLAIATYVADVIILKRWNEMAEYMYLTPDGAVAAMSAFASSVWFWIAIAMLILAILDFMFQRWQWSRDLMMTSQEAKEEMKEMDGDPRIRQRVRQIQRQMAMQRMMKNVPTADVIITNPVRFAVALRYDPTKMAAPVVVAKGARIVAGRIRELAMQHDVPIVERPELARALYRTIEVDQPVPEDLFKAIAEVLAFVYRVDRREEKRRERSAGKPMQAAM